MKGVLFKLGLATRLGFFRFIQDNILVKIWPHSVQRRWRLTHIRDWGLYYGTVRGQ